jgi:hypothetical protein
LKSIDEIEPYFVSRISVYARITEGVVLAVDGIFCTNIFLGIRQVDKGETADIFVTDLQPGTPETKCSPFFIIESEVGMVNDVIQRKIDEVIEITHRRISRVFLVSNGDPSYNDCHHAFMNFWEPIYEQWGLATVLTELKG